MTITKDSDILAREGYLIIIPSLIVVLGAFFFNAYVGAALCLWLAFCLYFFRNPKRVTPTGENNLVSPADGTILSISEETENEFLKKKMTRITIFMSPFNVHVNRVPLSGIVKNRTYRPGKFLAAFSEKASSENERSLIHMQTQEGQDLVFVQIAGWLARRIISYPEGGDSLEKGGIFGVIRFGSRMDVYLPEGFKPNVTKEQKVKAGETILALKG